MLTGDVFGGVIDGVAAGRIFDVTSVDDGTTVTTVTSFVGATSESMDSTMIDDNNVTSGNTGVVDDDAEV